MNESAAVCSQCGHAMRIGGRYELLQEIGRGSLGAVFRARDHQDDREVAVKSMVVIHPDAKRVERAGREVAVLAQLAHPGVPQYRDHVVDGRQVFLVQDLVPGRTLQAELADHRFDVLEVLGMLSDLLSILKWLHTRSPPIVHRDIKPGNVMRRPDGSLVLLDFGSVRDALADPELGGSTVAGTFGYMAPEQFRGDATPASDIYAAGALCVALLSRQDPAKLMDWSGSLRWQSAVDAHPAVLALLGSMVAQDPALRPSDAGALAVRVDTLRAGLVRGDLPIAVAPRPLAPRRRTSRVVLWIVLVAAIVMGAALYAAWYALAPAVAQVHDIQSRTSSPKVAAAYGDIVTDPGTGDSFPVLPAETVEASTVADLRSLYATAMSTIAEKGAWPTQLWNLGWKPTTPIDQYSVFWLDSDVAHAVIVRGPDEGRHWTMSVADGLDEGSRMRRELLFSTLAEKDFLGAGSEWWPDVR